MSAVKRRAKVERETWEYADMLGRMVKTYGRRVGSDSPEDLARMLELRAELDAAILEAIEGQRRLFSWGEIAAGVGMTRQAVQQMHARLRSRVSPGSLPAA